MSTPVKDLIKKSETKNNDTETEKSQTPEMPLAPKITPAENHATELPPISERVEKLNLLYSLCDKRDKLIELKESLKKFKVSSDNTRDCLSLEDGKGSSFKTYQADIVNEVMLLIRKIVDEKLQKVESQIVF